MKTFFTLLLSSLFSLTIFAADGSRLSISTLTRNVDLKIEVDGKKVTMNDENSITIRNLNEGYHSVKIFRQKKQNKNGQGQKMDVIYNSSVYVKKGFHMDITVNRFGKVLTDERRIDRNDEWYFDEEDGYFEDDHYSSNAISSRDLDQVKESLRKEWLESNRLKSAKFIIDNNNFTTIQVKSLMELFTFESNKLEIAKYGYGKTIDRKNYFLLNDALTFSNSKDELARFIRNYR
jgi:hypothetical protein